MMERQTVILTELWRSLLSALAMQAWYLLADPLHLSPRPRSSGRTRCPLLAGLLRAAQRQRLHSGFSI